MAHNKAINIMEYHDMESAGSGTVSACVIG
jgi:hypothetical protein